MKITMERSWRGKSSLLLFHLKRFITILVNIYSFMNLSTILAFDTPVPNSSKTFNVCSRSINSLSSSLNTEYFFQN